MRPGSEGVRVRRAFTTLAVLVRLGAGLRAGLCVGLCASAAWAQVPVERLRADLKTIAAPGSPGALVALTSAPRAVVLGRVGQGSFGPVCLATEWGAGRVVAFGHSGYADAATLKHADTATLIERIVEWTGGSKSARVGVLDGDLGQWLAARGFAPVGFDASNLNKDGLASIDVLIVGGRDLSDAQRDALGAWIRSGGGLIAAQTGWGWQQIKGGPDMRTNGLNRLLFDAGIAWTDEILDKTAGDDFDAKLTGNGSLSAPEALDALSASSAPGRGPGEKPDDQQERVMAQASATLLHAVRVLPADDAGLRPRLRTMMDEHAGELSPSERAPLGKDKALARVLLAVQIDDARSLPPEQVRAHPAASEFPGSVPMASDAPRQRRSVRIDTRVPRWHSTGLYAPAGEVVRVAVPAGASGLSLRIGCHTDGLWHLPVYKRVPQISRDWALGPGESRVASAFGGLVYVEVHKTGAGEIEVEIDGCVPAPLFVLGSTSKEQWAVIRNAPAPWGEIQTPSVIVSLPSSALRSLDDPSEIAALWQSVLDHAADLRQIPRARASPERYVPDVQISAGYMHSGYPIMTHMDAVGDMSVASRLRAGAWGLFHELGHNHQDAMWTFQGTGEVTCNLWSLYLMETVAGKPVSKGHEAIDSIEKRRQRAQRYMDTGAAFRTWQGDPFLALEMYMQLREAFGWEPFKRVFAEYDALAHAQRPQNEAARRDQWMVRMSRAVGRNLATFFERWGVPISASAKDSLQDLPGWMPSE